MKSLSLKLLRCLALACAVLWLPAHAEDAAASAPSPDIEADDESDATDVATAAPTKPDPSAEKFWNAIELLESKEDADKIAGRVLLQEASDLEFVHAQALLGNCHLTGSHGFRKDPKRAANLFRLAAERGNGFAMVSLGSCYAMGTGVRRDDVQALEWLQAALSPKADFTRPVPPEGFKREEPATEVAGQLVGDPVASSQATANFLVGQILNKRDQVAEAQKHFVAAATAGSDGRDGIFQAAVQAGINYAFGKGGIPRDPVKADEMLEQSVRLRTRQSISLIHNYVSLKVVDEFAVADLEEEVTQATRGAQSLVQYQIAREFGNKKSKDYNVKEAARWYELAAESGQVWGILSLAFLHANGELGQPDPEAAFRWFSRTVEGDKVKHWLGAANLAICLREGYGTAKDEARAAELFRKGKDIDIVCYLGTRGVSPRKVTTFEEATRLNQEWAKEKNDPHAQYLLAIRHYQGSGVKLDYEQGDRWLKRAAKANHGIALSELGGLYQFQPFRLNTSPAAAAAKAASHYLASGKAGYIEGLANYAQCLSTGYGVTKDEAAAIATYEECLKMDPDHSRTHSSLGAIFNEKLLRAHQAGSSMGTSEWREKMLAHYEASAAQETSFSAILLGDLYYEGRLLNRDFSRAYAYYEQASNVPVHKAAAHLRLGMMHEFGQGVPVTQTEAAYHYRIAALHGNVEALHRLSNFYLTGIGVSRDFDRAMYWLRYLLVLRQYDVLPTVSDVLLKKGDYKNAVQLLRSMTQLTQPAIAGHAHERLSLCYRTGNGVKASARRAEQHFKKAVELGNGNALATLAERQLAAGKIDEGVALFRRAADSSPAASFKLGQMYHFGTHIPEDRKAALKHFWQAARHGSTDAQYFLAVLTFNREPDAPTLEQAIELATRAEALGDARSTTVREKLEARRKQESERREEERRSRAL